MENAKDSQSVLTISLGLRAVANTFEEVQTFFPKRLGLVEFDGFAFRFAGDRNAIHPIDTMWIEHKLVVRVGIIEHRHFLISDDNQLLFLEWMQPADKNVGLDAALKAKNGQRHVRNRMVQITCTLRRDSGWRLTEQV